MPHSANRFCTLRAEMRLPSFERNSASSCAPNSSRRSSQCSTQLTALRPIGTRRSLLPLPSTHTSPLSRSRCLISRLTSSDRRRPAPYITSSIARSRTASGSLMSISSRRFTSSTSIFFGRWRAAFGAETPFAGLAGSSPWLTSQSKKLRSAESRSARLAAPSPLRRLRVAIERTVAASHCCQLLRPRSSAIAIMASSWR